MKRRDIIVLYIYNGTGGQQGKRFIFFMGGMNINRKPVPRFFLINLWAVDGLMTILSNLDNATLAEAI